MEFQDFSDMFIASDLKLRELELENDMDKGDYSEEFDMQDPLNGSVPFDNITLIWKCQTCSSRFSSAEEMQSHSRMHEIEAIEAENFEVSEEDENDASLESAMFNYHVRFIGTGPVTNPSNNSTLKSDSDQIYTEMPQRRYNKCPTCFKPHKTTKLLIAHQLREHPDIPVVLPQTYKCEFCEKSYDKVNSLYVHRYRKHPAWKEANVTPKGTNRSDMKVAKEGNTTASALIDDTDVICLD